MSYSTPRLSRREVLRRMAAVAPAALLLAGLRPCAAEHGVPVVNAAKCVGCGRCARIAANTFAVDPAKKKAYVKSPKGDGPELIAKAAAKCRRKAIVIG